MAAARVAHEESAGLFRRRRRLVRLFSCPASGPLSRCLFVLRPAQSLKMRRPRRLPLDFTHLQRARTKPINWFLESSPQSGRPADARAGPFIEAPSLLDQSIGHGLRRAQSWRASQAGRRKCNQQAIHWISGAFSNLHNNLLAGLGRWRPRRAEKR